MREAGLTHGGFYRHFGSREDLIEEAIDAALTPRTLSDVVHPKVADTALGAIFYRLLVTGGPIDEHLAQGIVELVLRGFAPTRTGAAT